MPPSKKKKKALGLSELRKDFFGTRAEVDTCLSPATPNPDGGMSLEGNEAPVLGYRKWPDQQQAGRSRGEGKAFQKEKKKPAQRQGDGSVACLGDCAFKHRAAPALRRHCLLVSPASRSGRAIGSEGQRRGTGNLRPHGCKTVV